MGRFILVVDDSLTVCKIIEVALHRAGFEVKCCANAELALQWLRSSEAHMPDLFLIDLLLPKMDGYSLIRCLRSQPFFRQTPFVIITRRNGLVDRLKGRLVGANAYLVKPLKIEEFVSVVQTYLGVPVPL